MNSKIWRQLALALSFVAIAAMTSYAQPGGGGGGRGGGGGGRGGGGGGNFGGGGGMFGALSGGGEARFALRADVKKELDLSDDQVAELGDVETPDMRAMLEDAGIEMRSMFRMSAEEREEALEPVTKKLKKANAESRDEVLDILSSKQKTRFKELKFQYDVSQGRAVTALTAAKVDVDDDDKEELEEAISKAGADLQKKIAELRMQMYIEAMGEVVGEDKVEDLMGKAFAFEQQTRGGRGGQAGGGRGGRGGGQAGGGRGGRGGGDASGGNTRRQRPDSGDDSDAPANPRRRGN